ncbi:MAG: hypothetical protein L6R41_008298 [Letrouitia leprolyta]|nr:MAG: hypothetical protein L6R41_008298 [Letrouitia leprolyta]
MIATSASGIHEDILFHMAPRLTSRDLRWAPKSLLLQDSTHLAIPVPGKSENRAFLNTKRKGLIAKLAGFRIIIAKPARPLPKVFTGFKYLPKDSDQRYILLLREDQGSWYLLSNRRDINAIRPPDLDETHALISALSSPWILFRGDSESAKPDSRRVHPCLLVDAGSKPQYPYDAFSCVEQNSQLIFRHLPPDMDTACRIAYSLVTRLASSAAAQTVEALLTTFALDDPTHVEVAQRFVLEMQRLSRMTNVMDTLHAVGVVNDEWISKSVREYLDRICCGQYVQVTTAVSGNSKWCIDWNRA